MLFSSFNILLLFHTVIIFFCIIIQCNPMLGTQKIAQLIVDPGHKRGVLINAESPIEHHLRGAIFSLVHNLQNGLGPNIITDIFDQPSNIHSDNIYNNNNYIYNNNK